MALRISRVKLTAVKRLPALTSMIATVEGDEPAGNQLIINDAQAPAEALASNSAVIDAAILECFRIKAGYLVLHSPVRWGRHSAPRLTRCR
jgi:hypothetical protein